MSTPSNQTLAGRYELEVQLGRGGSGTVWRGRDLVTRRAVAVKFVELEGGGDPAELAETIGRFRREVGLVTGLRHPNMVAALDAGRVGNEMYLVMELAQGVSLAQMTSDRAERGMGLLPVASVLRIADEVCIGLAAAHAAGVVHRDIKPANLMVTAQLGVKIIDFGIARLLNDNGPRVTRQGYTVGTPAYMSPEQARDEEVDGRTDIYSLGCVLYELLAGTVPFKAPTSQAVLMLQLEARAAPLRQLRPDVPVAVGDLVAEMMRKEREARPEAGEVIRRLLAVSGGLAGDEPTFEADRRTAMPGRPRGVPTGPPVADHRATRDATREATRDATRGVNAPDAGWLAAPGGGAVPPGRAQRRPAPPQLPEAPLAAPDRRVPPKAERGSAQAPAWPEPPARRPRSRWRSRIISSLVTAAIVAGVGVYLWTRDHQGLKITSVVAGPVSGAVGCAGTAVIPGVIYTNGHGGPVSYEWVFSKGQGTGPLTADDASGASIVQVQADWVLSGKGTGQVHAQLIVLSPAHAEADTSFSYSCTS
jgi:eukaryotic-like serine/threonine-protein kinase